jgi:hypothetical protein
MSFDEEYVDPHGECAAEIDRLRASVAELEAALEKSVVIEDLMPLLTLRARNTRLIKEGERLRALNAELVAALERNLSRFQDCGCGECQTILEAIAKAKELEQ